MWKYTTRAQLRNPTWHWCRKWDLKVNIFQIEDLSLAQAEGGKWGESDVGYRINL